MSTPSASTAARWVIALGALVVVLMIVFMARRGPTPPGAPASSGGQVMVRLTAAYVSPASAPGVVTSLGMDPTRHGRTVLAGAQRPLAGLISAGMATTLSSPSLVLNDASTGTLEVIDTTGGARDVFVAQATPTIIDGGVSLDITISRSTAEGPIELVMQDLGLGGRRSTSRELPPIGPGDAVVLWLAQEPGGVLVEVTASELP